MIHHTLLKKQFRFLICRHGESIWNKDNKFAGWTEIPLTDKGKNDCLITAKKLLSNHFIPDKIYTSDLIRTKETAEIIKNAINPNIETESCWRINERHYGSCEGIKRSLLKDRFGKEYLKKVRNNFYIRPPLLDFIDNDSNVYINNTITQIYNSNNNAKKSYYINNHLIKYGESSSMVSNRFLKFINEIAIKNKNELPLIVSHKHPIRILLKEIFNLNEEKFEDLDIINNTIFYVTISPNGDLSANEI